MNWSTPVSVPPGTTQLNYSNSVVVLGSCFATHLGEKLAYFQFRSLTNPFGVIFHPKPLNALVQRALTEQNFTEDELFEHQSLWRSFQVHSSLAQPDKKRALEVLNQSLHNFRTSLISASHLVLTLGSAYVYVHKSSKLSVANCHTVRASEFDKILSAPEEIQDQLEQLSAAVRALNPNIQLLLTVSPVRHIRDGLVESQRSKAHLITAVHRLVDNGKVAYFPSYELLLDELRDYRFYDRDLIHPSAAAVDFIWDRFRETWVAPSVYPLLQEVDSIRKGLQHRPLHPDSEAHLAFTQKLQNRIALLQQQYPFMQF